MFDTALVGIWKYLEVYVLNSMVKIIKKISLDFHFSDSSHKNWKSFHFLGLCFQD